MQNMTSLPGSATEERNNFKGENIFFGTTGISLTSCLAQSGTLLVVNYYSLFHSIDFEAP